MNKIATGDQHIFCNSEILFFETRYTAARLRN